MGIFHKITKCKDKDGKKCKNPENEKKICNIKTCPRLKKNKI